MKTNVIGIIDTVTNLHKYSHLIFERSTQNMHWKKMASLKKKGAGNTGFPPANN
jgi:hypothetical protein